MDRYAALEETWTALRALLADVKPAEWDLATPCEAWSVRDLAAHLGAVEGGFQGFEQPSPPAGWSTDAQGIDAWTAQGVAARQAWPIEQVLDEVNRAAGAQLDRLRGLDEAGWDAETTGPLGPTTVRGLAEIRGFDLWVHLLDLRAALGRPLAPDGEPNAQQLAAGRAWSLSGWAAVKKAKLPDGTRLRISLTGAAANEGDLVVDGGRATFVAPGELPAERVEGTATAYLLVASGRPELADDAGGLTTHGTAAAHFVERYRMFG